MTTTPDEATRTTLVEMSQQLGDGALDGTIAGAITVVLGPGKAGLGIRWSGNMTSFEVMGVLNLAHLIVLNQTGGSAPGR
jgi:hypothetical protein